jgi:hypothetical protein
MVAVTIERCDGGGARVAATAIPVQIPNALL